MSIVSIALHLQLTTKPELNLNDKDVFPQDYLARKEKRQLMWSF